MRHVGASITICMFMSLHMVASASEGPEVPASELTGFPRASPQVFLAAVNGLEAYRNTRPYKDKWHISKSEPNGTIETDWYPEHKGEVTLKVQIAVWGNSFRVDVWQAVGLLPSATKTEWSRRAERHIQAAIESQLSLGK